MSVTLSPIGGVAGQFFDNNGQPLSGGKIYTYAAGTTTPQATYTSAAGSTPHSNPIILDSAGRVPGGEIWLTDSLLYKFVIETSTAILIGTYDNISGINSNFVNYTVQEEVQTATAGQTVFTLTTINYSPGTNSLSVYIDGVNQYIGTSYLETDSTTVTFTSGLHVGAEVKFTTAVQSTTGAVNASIVTYDPPFTGGVATNVEAKLSEYVSVKDFGAVGDGVTDDTAAIQAAIATGLALFFPEPSAYYKIQSNIAFTSPISAGLYRIFGGAGVVTIGDSTTQVFSEWWGDTTSRSTSFGPDNLVTATGIGVEQTVFGRGSLKSLTTGYANGAFGIDVLPDNTTGSFNFAYGIKTLWKNISGSSNSAFGAYSMQANLSGSANVSFGEDTNRYLESADGNVAVGVQALYNNVTGTENVAVGRYAARNASNPPDAGPGTGPSPSYITAVGAYALYQAQGTFNAAVGHQSGYACSGDYNSFLGAQSGLNLTSGGYNVFIGYRSGQNASQAAIVSNCIAVGDGAYTTGDNAVAIGSGVSSPANIFTVCNSAHTFFRPSTDNVTAMGGPSNRWTVVYAATGTINTSDEREKQQIKPIDDAALRAWAKVEYCQFKFNDAVEKKGNDARWHFGLIAQRVKEAFESEGLDAFAYGLLCHDTWENGGRYGIRYEEALALECAYLRSKLG